MRNLGRPDQNVVSSFIRGNRKNWPVIVSEIDHWPGGSGHRNVLIFEGGWEWWFVHPIHGIRIYNFAKNRQEKCQWFLIRFSNPYIRDWCNTSILCADYTILCWFVAVLVCWKTYNDHSVSLSGRSSWVGPASGLQFHSIPVHVLQGWSLISFRLINIIFLLKKESNNCIISGLSEIMLTVQPRSTGCK